LIQLRAKSDNTFTSAKERRRQSVEGAFEGLYARWQNLEVPREVLKRHADQNVVFADRAERIRFSQAKGKGAARENVLVLLTKKKLYVFGGATEDEAKAAAKAKLSLPKCLLRREVPVDAIDGATLSTFADNFVALRVGSSFIRTGVVPVASWVDGKVCEGCKSAFGLFNRKHHCRVSGGVFCKKCSSILLPVPDLPAECRHGAKNELEPVRIATSKLGLMACELPQDLVLECEHKTELVAILMELRRELGRPIAPAFQNGMSVSEGGTVSFAKGVGIDKAQVTVKPNNSVDVASPGGMSKKDVEKRMAVLRDEAARLDAQRRADMEERRRRDADRAALRERERLERVAAKKARRAEANAQDAEAEERALKAKEKMSAIRTGGASSASAGRFGVGGMDGPRASTAAASLASGAGAAKKAEVAPAPVAVAPARPAPAPPAAVVEEEEEEGVLFEVEAEYDFEKSEEIHYSLVAGQRYKVPNHAFRNYGP
jgi:myosin-1